MSEKMMSISTAMRLGSLMKPQAFGVIFNSDFTETCALGAAIDAAGLPFVEADSGQYATSGRDSLVMRGGEKVCRLPKEWLTFLLDIHQCPKCTVRTQGVYLIGHMNDTHRLTREHIADIVERLEANQLPGPEHVREEAEVCQ
jgi:hypothetical protein